MMKKLLLSLFITLLISFNIQAQIPALNSLPASEYVIYLDFDGEVVDNPWWDDNVINAPAVMSAKKRLVNFVAFMLYIFCLNNNIS